MTLAFLKAYGSLMVKETFVQVSNDMLDRLLRALASELFHLRPPVECANATPQGFRPPAQALLTASLHPSRSRFFRWSSKISTLAL